MLGDSSSVLATTTTAPDGGSGGGGGGNNGEAPPPSAPRTHLLPPGGGGAHESTSEAGHVGSNNNSGEEDKGRGGGDEGDRSFGGNRWPRQETLALLKIRSDMDVAFRDASVKGPLWEEVSRKLAELGYNRSAKKCKEKFENVYKYHKRTKEGRSGKQEGKNYRFFDQLEAFENHPPPSFSSPPPPQPQPQQQQPPIITTIAMPSPPISHISTTVPSTTAKHVADHHQRIITTGINLTIPSSTNPTISSQEKNPTNVSFSAELVSNSTSSSSTSSDVEIQGRRKKKRKWKDFFERLMKEVIHKQEDMQKKFLEAIEKREHDRMIREESWRMQEMARINREREILAQERSMSAAKDAAVMAFLQKLSEQQNPIGQHNNPPPTQPQPPPVQAVATPPPPPPPPAAGPPQPAPAPEPAPAPQPQQAVAVTNLETKTDNNGDQGFNLLSGGSSSRWPKVEVQALINLRTNLDSKYQDNGPKGPLWEEISAGMRKLGYNRSAKRCKEKWENINKYFKKVKESNKKRPEDSKTCPYFHQLDALYKEKNANIQFKPENSVPLMVQPEQQWPPPAPPPPPLNSSSHHQHPQESVMEDLESDQDHQSHQEEDDKDNDDDDDDDDDEAGGYEIVANRPTSISSAG